MNYLRGAAWHTAVGRGDCVHRCLGGNPCACSNRAHAHHICNNPACACHAAESYGLAWQGRAGDKGQYVPLAFAAKGE